MFIHTKVVPSRKDQKIGFIAKVSLVGRALAWGFWSRLVLQI